MRVCAVVVTYNRRALLAQCLQALRQQTRPADHVMVIDNASTDGTADFVRAHHGDLELIVLKHNEGGAGGFHEGLRRGHAAGFDWIWLMDDDTIPAPQALAELLAAPARLGLSPPPVLLTSKVVWSDGRMHPMNHPGFERLRTDLVLTGCERGLMPLRTTTFVSLLVHRDAVTRHGLPLKRYFLWSDDIEYTARILRHEPGFLVPDSIALHKTREPYTAITTSGERFYYHVRNTLYMLRGPAWRPSEKPSLLFGLVLSVAAYLRFNHFARHSVTVVLRGMRAGLDLRAPVPSRP